MTDQFIRESWLPVFKSLMTSNSSFFFLCSVFVIFTSFLFISDPSESWEWWINFGPCFWLHCDWETNPLDCVWPSCYHVLISILFFFIWTGYFSIFFINQSLWWIMVNFACQTSEILRYQWDYIHISEPMLSQFFTSALRLYSYWSVFLITHAFFLLFNK
jgi:hypothetical protein